MESEQNTSGPSLLSAIITAIGMALLLVLVTFFIFISSGAYTTVKQIQAGSKITRSLQNGDIDTRSPIKADDIDSYQASIDQRLKTIDNTTDFGVSGVSDRALGLSQ